MNSKGKKKKMEWTTSEKDGILVVTLDGRLVAASVDDVQDAILPLIEKNPNAVFDLAKMVHIDSSGLGLLVRLLQKAMEKGGALKLASLQPHPKIVFDITKAHRVFEIHDSLDAALASFQKKDGAQ